MFSWSLAQYLKKNITVQALNLCFLFENFLTLLLYFLLIHDKLANTVALQVILM